MGKPQIQWKHQEAVKQAELEQLDNKLNLIRLLVLEVIFSTYSKAGADSPAR